MGRSLVSQCRLIVRTGGLTVAPRRLKITRPVGQVSRSTVSLGRISVGIRGVRILTPSSLGRGRRRARCSQRILLSHPAPGTQTSDKLGQLTRPLTRRVCPSPRRLTPLIRGLQPRDP